MLGVWAGWRFGEARTTYLAWIDARQAHPAVPATSVDEPSAMQAALAAMRPAPPERSRPAQRKTTRRLAGAPPGPENRAVTPPASIPNTLAAATEPDSAFVLADAAYRDLAGGNRRSAASNFRSALESDPRHPNARLWLAELRRLEKRWNFEAYSLLRDGGGSIAPNAQPLLGGGQSGARVSYTPDPFGSRPIELFTRFNIAQDWQDFDSESAQAAFGAAWQPFGRRAPSISAERMVAIGRSGRDAWAARVAGGAAHAADARLPLDLSAYAEAGIAGLRRGDFFAGGQAYAMLPLFSADHSWAAIGSGMWGSAQDSDTFTLWRVEVGPSAQLSRRIGAGTIEMRAEYRVHIAGNAEPGSGPSLTLATRF